MSTFSYVCQSAAEKTEKYHAASQLGARERMLDLQTAFSRYEAFPDTCTKLGHTRSVRHQAFFTALSQIFVQSFLGLIRETQCTAIRSNTSWSPTLEAGNRPANQPSMMRRLIAIQRRMKMKDKRPKATKTHPRTTPAQNRQTASEERSVASDGSSSASRST